jgi:hypothetical protein
MWCKARTAEHLVTRFVFVLVNMSRCPLGFSEAQVEHAANP